jgi:competence protein ComGC
MKNRWGKSFITIMIVTAACALILRLVIKQIIKTNINQNESNAKAALKLISAALENYAKDNKGLYPENIAALTKTSPAYLDNDDMFSSPLKGYVFTCLRLEPSEYSCSAIPSKCNLTGQMAYTVIRGGSFISEKCSKEE